jgi:tetratricopeptide (TPR) repeat protein
MLGNGHIERARLLLSQGRTKEAERQVGYVLQEDPEDEEALLVLAECKVDTKQFAEAENILKKSIGIEPGYDRPYYLLAFVNYQQNKLLFAKESLDKAIRINPYHAAYFGLYAYIHIDERDYKAALEKANEGLAVYAEELTCLNARSQALFRLKNKEKAYETIQEALAIDPEDDFTHTNFAWHYLEKGKHKKAREHFREALRINPNNNRARQGYKESLKANLPPYRWILMFSLWLSSKSKSVRWITVIVIWAGVRLLSGASEAAGWSTLAYVIILLYLLFVLFSWIGNSLANLMLLFTKEGKYVLTNSEKYSSASVGAVLLISIVTIILGAILSKRDDGSYLISAIIFLSLTLPLSKIEYPLDLHRKKFVYWYTLLLTVAGIITGILSLIFGSSVLVAALVYLALFILYTWVFSFSH